jgi:hypothetical protein
MGLPNVAVNISAIVGAAAASFVIGMLWYSPVLFGNAWMKAGGFSKKDIDKSKKKGMGKMMFASFIGSLVMAWILSYFVVYASAGNFVDGMKIGFWLTIGLIAPVLLSSVLWEGKVVKYYLINLAFWLVSVSVMGGILTVWR